MVIIVATVFESQLPPGHEKNAQFCSHWMNSHETFRECFSHLKLVFSFYGFEIEPLEGILCHNM